MMLNKQKMSLEQAEAEVAELRAALVLAEQRLDAIRGCTRREYAKQRSRDLVAELVDRREELEWSVGYLAKALGCGRDNVAQRESGGVWPTQAVVSSWCKALGGGLWLVEPVSGYKQELACSPLEVVAQLVELRERHGWSRAELAQRLGISSTLVAQREAGLASVRGPHLPVLLEWIHALKHELMFVLV
jgi:transcriptional regulator with XRE-family HTH domain